MEEMPRAGEVHRHASGLGCRDDLLIAHWVVARGGVEPPTFRFSVGRSYQLSYLAEQSKASFR